MSAPLSARCPTCGRDVAVTIVPDCPTTIPDRREADRARRLFGIDSKETP